jgi:hypothetical protein
MPFIDKLAAFAFVVLVPVVAAAGALVSLFAVGALFNALDDPKGWEATLRSIFRRPTAPPKPPGKDHYYKPFWVSR